MVSKLLPGKPSARVPRCSNFSTVSSCRKNEADGQGINLLCQDLPRFEGVEVKGPLVVSTTLPITQLLTLIPSVYHPERGGDSKRLRLIVSLATLPLPEYSFSGWGDEKQDHTALPFWLAIPDPTPAHFQWKSIGKEDCGHVGN